MNAMTEDDLATTENDKTITKNDKAKEFNAKRKIFYFDNKTGDIRFPSIEYVNLSHQEWFEKIKVNIEKVIRGYYDGVNVYCYIGNDFKVPNITINQIFQLHSIFSIYSFYLGVIPSKIGEKWKPINEIIIKNIIK